MNIEKLDNKRLNKAFETCGIHKVQIIDKTHGFLYIDTTKQNIPNVGKRYFVCVSSKDAPDNYSTKLNADLFGKALLASWSRYASAVVEEEKEMLEIEEDKQPPAPPVQPTPSPPKLATQPTPSPPLITATAVVTPEQLKDDDDLLSFFRSIVNPSYLEKADLFRPEVTGKDLRDKIKLFAKSISTESLVKHYESFYGSAPVQYKVKDISVLEPCPLLHKKYGIPMNVPAMREVAAALLNLAEDVPEVLQLQKHGGSKGYGKRLVAIVPSMDASRLYYNAKRWMEEIVNFATADEADMSSYDTVQVLVRVLCSLDADAFNAVASAMPQLDHAKVKLNAELQQAMMFDVHVNFSQMRTIKKYLCHANIDMLQPESVMRGLLVEDFIKPIPIEFREGKGKRRRVCWSIPIDELLVFNTNKHLEANTFDHDKLTRAHVILVGDHDQGAFRMMATLLLITRPGRRRRPNSPVNCCVETKLALEVDGLCAYIQCLKDTYQILKETIATPINDALRRIKLAGKVTIYRDTLDKNKTKICFGNTHTHNVVLGYAEVDIFVTGDLAFYSMVLGKESMAGHWCWRCKLTKKQWTSNTDVCIGVPWTVEGLRRHYAKIQAGTIDKSKSNLVKGVTEEPLFDALVANYLVPSLHSNELFINHPINKGLMVWIYHRIERIPMEVIVARMAYVDSIIKGQDLTASIVEANASISTLEAEREAIGHPVKRRGRAEEYRDEQHRLDYSENAIQLVHAKERVKELNKDLAAIKRETKSAKRELTKKEKDKKLSGALTQEIRQRVEQMLQDMFNILQSAYHGGCLLYTSDAADE